MAPKPHATRFMAATDRPRGVAPGAGREGKREAEREATAMMLLSVVSGSCERAVLYAAREVRSGGVKVGVQICIRMPVPGEEKGRVERMPSRKISRA